MLRVSVTQSCLTAIRGLLQVRTLECGAISFSRDLPKLGMEPGSPALQADSSPSEPSGKLARCMARPKQKQKNLEVHVSFLKLELRG